MATLFSLAACATPSSHVLPPYTLSNGAQLQDVVTIAGDPGGGAPSLTVLTTYDVSRRDYTVMLSREFAAGQPVGPEIGKGLALGVPIAIGAIGAAAIRGEDKSFVQATSYTTQGNISYGGDAGDIDAANQAIETCSAEGGCTVSN